jgi:hypothetical protein
MVNAAENQCSLTREVSITGGAAKKQIPISISLGKMLTSSDDLIH